MSEQIWKLKKCERCDWMFIMSREDAVLCNNCGDNQNHPRVCQVGGTTTSLEALLKLVPYMLDFVSGAVNMTVKDLVGQDVNRALEEGD